MNPRQGYGMMAVALAIVGALVLVGMRVDGGSAVETDRPAAGVDAVADEGAASNDTVALAPVPLDTVPAEPTLPPASPPTPDENCTLADELREGAASADVACLQAALVAEGLLDGTDVDGVFGAATVEAVRRHQSATGLRVDAVVGRVTASSLGIWPPPPAPDPATCEATGRSVVVDRQEQRAWFCADGAITRQIPITSAWSQPDPGRYTVYAKDLNASSSLTETYSTMTHFVAFTHGKVSGARIAFHSVPTLTDGSWLQPLDTVGSLTQRGDSEGCIRLLPDDAVAVWDWLAMGDVVRVIS